MLTRCLRVDMQSHEPSCIPTRRPWCARSLTTYLHHWTRASGRWGCQPQLLTMHLYHVQGWRVCPQLVAKASSSSSRGNLGAPEPPSFGSIQMLLKPFLHGRLVTSTYLLDWGCATEAYIMWMLWLASHSWLWCERIVCHCQWWWHGGTHNERLYSFRGRWWRSLRLCWC